MHRTSFAVIFVLCLASCSSKEEQTSPYITEHDARIISIAREAALANGFSLKDTIYSIRPEGTGWIVQVDRSPGYDGKGGPVSVVVDGTFFVHLDADEHVVEFNSFAGIFKPKTMPSQNSKEK